MVTNCPKCGLPRFAGVGGYAGPQCTCLVTNFAVVDPVVRQQQEIESLRQQLSASQKREVMLREALEDKATKALFRAWSLGQKYWQQADSDSYTQNAKATMTQKKFQELIDEFRSGEWTPETLAGERLEAIFYQDGNGTRWVYSEDACASISGPDSDDREIGRAVLCLGANP